MKKPIDCNVYDLIPSQDMILFMLKYSFFHKQVTQIPESILTTRKIDFDLMQKALKIEIERNDCLRLKFFKQKGKTKQYFLKELEAPKIPVLNFKTEQEQVDTLTADAQTAIKIYKGETYRIKFFRSFDGRFGIYICVHHLVMDNAACLTFFSDLLAVYDHLETGAPLPKPLGKYEDGIKRELDWISNPQNIKDEEEEYKKHVMEFGEPTYLGIEGQKYLEAERKKKKDENVKYVSLFDPIHDKSGFAKKVIPYELSQRVIKFMDEHQIGGECLIQLAMRLYLAKINNGILTSYFITLCPRRRTLSQKRSGGTYAEPLPWLLALKEDDTFLDAMANIQDQQRWAFRHMDYPYLEYRTLQQKLFNYSAAAASSTMMFSWFPLEEGTMNNWDYEFVGYSIGHYVMVLYTFAMKDVKHGTIKITYQHRTKFVSQEDIDKFQSGLENVLDIVTENPELKISEILEKLNRRYIYE